MSARAAACSSKEGGGVIEMLNQKQLASILGLVRGSAPPWARAREAGVAAPVLMGPQGPLVAVQT
jgi:hypothetical protein